MGLGDIAFSGQLTSGRRRGTLVAEMTLTGSRIKRRGWFLVPLIATLLAAPAAWAVGWVNVGPAGIHLDDGPWYGDVGTGTAVYSDKLRLYVTTHSPCGGPNYGFTYDYPDGSLYQWAGYYEICTAAETPATWYYSGGNKKDLCWDNHREPTDPAVTCQRYSTT